MYVSPASFSRSALRSGLGSTTSVTAATIANQGLTITTSILKAIETIGGPVGSVIAAIGQLGVMLAQVFQGCGQTCIAASNYANQVEQILQQNLSTYLSSPTRTTSMQAAAVNNYNTAIAALQQACGQASLGSAGVNCIDERIDPGSCTWKAQAGGWDATTCTYTPWGASGSGSSCWNWVIGYLDPIQNDPCVQPDSVLGGGTGTGSTVFGISTPLAIGGLLLAALLLGGD